MRPVRLGRLLWWLSEGDTMGRNYVSFDRKAAEARVRTERKRRERDRLKTEEAAIWDQFVAEQLEAAACEDYTSAVAPDCSYSLARGSARGLEEDAGSVARREG